MLCAAGLGGPVAAQEASALYGACFARTYDAKHLAAHRGQRVSAISVLFQGFEDSLLAAVSYRLRSGPKFGFSGDCHVVIEGGYFCQSCGNDVCEGTGETFKILWSGGETVQLVNDTTGVLAKNAEGGRDYLRSGGEHGVFLLNRAAPDACNW